MNIKIRAVALVLALSLSLTVLAGCGKQPDVTDESTTVSQQTNEDNKTKKQQVTLPFAKTDVLNPFGVYSLLNSQLVPLFFDSLYTVQAGNVPQPCIAQNGKVDGKNVTVTLKSVQFTDGTALTAEDVVYSFTKAKKSKLYAQRLSNVTAAKAQKDGSVLFTLAALDPYVLSVLDFAIVKNKTADTEKPKETQTGYFISVKTMPVGSGRYVLKEQGADFYCQANTKRLGGFSPRCDKILLAPVGNSDGMRYALEIGDYDFFYDDLSSGTYTRINATTQEVPRNNLLYLTFNSQNALLKEPGLRRTLASLLDGSAIAAQAYQGHARVTNQPFRMDWHALAGAEGYLTLSPADVELTLTNMGFDKVNNGVRAKKNGGGKLSFNLVVCDGNPYRVAAAEQIAQMFAQVQVTVKVQKLKKDAYQTAVKAGKFDMYLGEVRLCANMNLSPLLAKGAVSYGISATGDAAVAYGKLLGGEMTVPQFVTAFCDDMPFVPLCYTSGVAASARALLGTDLGSEGDLLSQVENWHF